MEWTKSRRSTFAMRSTLPGASVVVWLRRIRMTPPTMIATVRRRSQKPGRRNGLGLCREGRAVLDVGALSDKSTRGAVIGSVSVIARWDVDAIVCNELEPA